MLIRIYRTVPDLRSGTTLSREIARMTMRTELKLIQVCMNYNFYLWERVSRVVNATFRISRCVTVRTDLDSTK